LSYIVMLTAPAFPSQGAQPARQRGPSHLFRNRLVRDHRNTPHNRCTLLPICKAPVSQPGQSKSCENCYHHPRWWNWDGPSAPTVPSMQTKGLVAPNQHAHALTVLRMANGSVGEIASNAGRQLNPNSILLLSGYYRTPAGGTHPDRLYRPGV
jgi:hypothetical protein